MKARRPAWQSVKPSKLLAQHHPARVRIEMSDSMKFDVIRLELERQAAVSEAWLNRAGRMLAVVWTPESKRKDRIAAFKTVSKQEQLEARELHGAAKKKALKDFRSGDGWLRGSDVDRLSEEEAGIMAARLVKKIKTIVPLSDEKSTLIERQSAEIFKRRLTGQTSEELPPKEQVLKILQKHLDAKEVSLLQEALKDYRPGRDQP